MPARPGPESAGEATARPWRIAPETRPQSNRRLTFVETIPDDESADGEVICTLRNRVDAELIVAAVNAQWSPGDRRCESCDSGLNSDWDFCPFCGWHDEEYARAQESGHE